jgi:hypothetical protein
MSELAAKSVRVAVRSGRATADTKRLRLEVVPVEAASKEAVTAAEDSFTRFVARQIAREILEELRATKKISVESH